MRQPGNIWRRSLGVSAATCLVLALAQLALVRAVDPYRFFGTRPVAGLTAIKPAVAHQSLITRNYMLARADAQTVILGNSRMEVGLDPASPAWPRACLPVFNAAEPGYGLDTALTRLRIALAAHPVRLAVVAVDYADALLPLDAEPAPMPDAALAMRPFTTQGWAEDALATSLNLTALVDAGLTLLGQDAQFGTDVRSDGFNPLHEYRRAVREIGYAGLFAQKAQSTRAQLAAQHAMVFETARYHQLFAYLDAILDLARSHGVRVGILISPYHAQMHAIWAQAGFGPGFDAFTAALRTHVAARGQADLRLIDFSGKSPYTEEAVPAPGDTTTDMRWYWEAGHFKSALGDLVIARLFAPPQAGPNGFGVDLLENPHPLACD